MQQQLEVQGLFVLGTLAGLHLAKIVLVGPPAHFHLLLQAMKLALQLLHLNLVSLLAAAELCLQLFQVGSSAPVL